MEAFRALRPEPAEHHPHYAKYVQRVPDGDIVASLRAQLAGASELLASISEARAGMTYEPGKWTVKELLGHINDTERIMAYRALRFSRNDLRQLEGFEQDDYVRNGPSSRCSWPALRAEYAHVREATVDLFAALDETAWNRRAVASIGEVSVRALAWIIAGHELHHLAILRERYLPAMKWA